MDFTRPFRAVCVTLFRAAGVQRCWDIYPAVRNLSAKNAVTMERLWKVASGTVFCASYIVSFEWNTEGMFQQIAGNNELPCIYLHKS